MTLGSLALSPAFQGGTVGRHGTVGNVAAVIKKKKAGKRMIRASVFALILGVVCCPNDLRAAYVIDDFTEGQIAIEFPPMSGIFQPQSYVGNVPTITEGSFGSIAGGFRSISATNATTVGSVAISENIPGYAPTPSLNFNASGGSLYTTMIKYDANGALGGLGAIDLTQMGVNDAIQVVAKSADKGIRFKLTVTDIFGNGSSVEDVPLGIGTPTPIYFTFASFVPVVDFTQVASVVLEISAIDQNINGVGNKDLDWSITNISAVVSVPEPTSIALAGFAGIGMAVGAIRRRRQAKQAA